jgi:tetratricopeptide (TPR) repeat protein
VTTRWPFVTRSQAIDYRGTYRPTDPADSLALLVSRGGMAWAEAKTRVGAMYIARGFPDSAAAEYRGLVRDRPFLESSHRLLGRALVAAGRFAEAAPSLERAGALAEHPETDYLLGRVALEQKDYPRAITLLDRAVTMSPDAVAPLYQLSLAFGMSHNLDAARAAAARVARLDPRYPGLAEWMATLQMRSP